LEEAYELAEAISSGEPARVAAELGDLLLHVFLHARVAEEQGQFDVDDVARLAVEKLRRRHPHVFGRGTARTPAEVRRSWEQIKREEAEASGTLDVPSRLPALFRAKRVQERAAAVGFDWPDVRGVMEKIKEELRELEGAVEAGNGQEITRELGDLLFSVVNLSRFASVDPEEALQATIRRFSRRFEAMERRLDQMGTPIATADLELMDSVWEELKREEQAGC
jgi:tetrapyrrole methylase family protein/MazG family protein